MSTTVISYRILVCMLCVMLFVPMVSAETVVLSSSQDTLIQYVASDGQKVSTLLEPISIGGTRVTTVVGSSAPTSRNSGNSFEDEVSYLVLAANLYSSQLTLYDYSDPDLPALTAGVVLTVEEYYLPITVSGYDLSVSQNGRSSRVATGPPPAPATTPTAPSTTPATADTPATAGTLTDDDVTAANNWFASKSGSQTQSGSPQASSSTGNMKLIGEDKIGVVVGSEKYFFGKDDDGKLIGAIRTDNAVVDIPSEILAQAGITSLSSFKEKDGKILVGTETLSEITATSITLVPADGKTHTLAYANQAQGIISDTPAGSEQPSTFIFTQSRGLRLELRGAAAGKDSDDKSVQYKLTQKTGDSIRTVTVTTEDAKQLTENIDKLQALFQHAIAQGIDINAETLRQAIDKTDKDGNPITSISFGDSTRLFFGTTATVSVHTFESGDLSEATVVREDGTTTKYTLQGVSLTKEGKDDKGKPITLDTSADFVKAITNNDDSKLTNYLVKQYESQVGDKPFKTPLRIETIEFDITGKQTYADYIALEPGDKDTVQYIHETQTTKKNIITVVQVTGSLKQDSADKSKLIYSLNEQSTVAYELEITGNKKTGTILTVLDDQGSPTASKFKVKNGLLGAKLTCIDKTDCNKESRAFKEAEKAFKESQLTNRKLTIQDARKRYEVYRDSVTGYKALSIENYQVTDFMRDMQWAENFGALSSLFVGSERFAKWESQVKELIPTTDRWVETMCKANLKPDGPQNTAFVKLPDGSVSAAATTGGECSSPVTAYDVTERLYKFSAYVANPQGVPEETPLRFDIYIQDDSGERHALFDDAFALDPGGVLSLTGPDAVSRFSDKLFTQICIEFENPPEIFEDNTLCNAITCREIPEGGYTAPPLLEQDNPFNEDTVSGDEAIESQPGGAPSINEDIFG
ncbi:MAG: hypothetical protein ACI8Y7_000098 [Candidatus Woesearchaeota archaeon]|jgi:hypothetical protein